MFALRPASVFALVLFGLLLLDMSLVGHTLLQRNSQREQEMYILTETLGISDLCLATEARYTRHLTLSDGIAPFMDHPVALEHFPSGSFYGRVE